jgi:hypothetical protein
MLANKFARLVSRLLPRISVLIGLAFIPCGKKSNTHSHTRVLTIISLELPFPIRGHKDHISAKAIALGERS